MRLVKGKLFFLTIFLLFGSAFISVAQNIPARPNPPHLVNDFANMLSASEGQLLENKLVAYADSTSTQIAIVTVESLDGAPVQQFAAELGYKWGVGTKENHNGVVILISKGDRKGYIATGYGVEDGLNSAKCDEIYLGILVPNLKQGNAFVAFDKSTDAMIAILSGKFVNTNVGGGKEDISPLVIFAIIFIIFLVIMIARSKSNGTHISRRGYLDTGPTWIGGGDWGGRGSSIGGGFGGFGGGDFSGGGAGGDW